MTARTRPSSPSRPNILLRNRARHLRDRDSYYHQALTDLDELVIELPGTIRTTEGLERFKSLVEKLALSFKRALSHAIFAAGGDFDRTRSLEIGPEEMVFSDYLKTMYSAARNIESYLSHELMLHQFAHEQEHLDPLVRQYIDQTDRYDTDIILRNVDLLKNRAKIFNRSFYPGLVLKSAEPPHE